MEYNLEILTEKQKVAWTLREQGMTIKTIAAEMGISTTGVTSHIHHAERRFREYERHLAHQEANKKVADITLTRGDCSLLVNALLAYEAKLIHDAHYNVKTDWRGRLPYEAQLIQPLSEKLQLCVYGHVIFHSILEDEQAAEGNLTEPNANSCAQE